MARTDPHTPSRIVPADYGFCDYFGSYRVPYEHDVDGGPLYETYGDGAAAAYLDGPQVETPWRGHLFNCDVCGAHYIHGATFVYSETGEYVSMGQDCAEKYLAVSKLTDKQRGTRAGRVGRQRVTRRRMRDALRVTPGLGKLLKLDHPIAQDIRAHFIRSGRVSEAQVNLLRKIEPEVAAYVAQREARAAEVPADVPVTDERVKIEGVVQSIKWRRDEYSYDESAGTFKMTVRVKTPVGVFRVWGTCPDAKVNDIERGSIVEFMCRVVPSDDDSSFGFFKRPTKLVVKGTE